MAVKRALRILWVVALAHVAITWLLAVRRGWSARQRHDQVPPPPPVELPPVSVIVPAWNEQGTVERNIAALRQLQYPCWEAIMVAGGDDGTYGAALAAAAGDDRLHVLLRGPEPKNAALKKGIQVAQHDILVLLDCDNIVEPGWLAALIAPMARGASVSVGNSRPNRITWVTLEERMWNIHIYQVLGLSLIQGDRSIAIRRKLLESIGGLPEHTYAREDWDIWARLGKSGERIEFAEGALLTTDRPATLAESWQHQVRWRRTHLTGMWEHRRMLLRTPTEAFGQVYGYLLSTALGLGVIAAPLLAAAVPNARPAIAQLALMAAGWLGLRRAALGAEIAAYTGERAWLRRAWLPAATLGLEVAASLVALLSLRDQTALYKGPRHAPAPEANAAPESAVLT